MKFYVLLCMIFMHIVDDYYLQGILASMKQRSWWEKNAPQEKYKYDYLAALIAHSFSWAFMVLLPFAFSLKSIDFSFFILFFINMIGHAIVDNEKANRKTINLCEDQFVHLIQIILSWLYLFIN